MEINRTGTIETNLVYDERRLVGGYPKTGRTWVRYMLASALTKEHGIDEEIDLRTVYNIIPNDTSGQVPGQPLFSYEGVLPKIEMTHDNFNESFNNSRYIFMTRDPRDVMVSHWLHHRKQLGQFDGDLSDFIRSNQGISRFTDHLESWSSKVSSDQVISYETLSADPQRALARLATNLSFQLGSASIEYAVQQGQISKMRQKEIEKGIAGHDYDRNDPEALRIRRGVVGGYVEYLSPEDEAYIHRVVDQVGYNAQSILSQTAYSRPGA